MKQGKEAPRGSGPFVGIFRRQAMEAFSAPKQDRGPLRVRPGRRPRRVPVVHQTTAVDCGAACLAMILGAFGRATTLAEAREELGECRNGVTAADLAEAARRFGLDAQGYRADVDDLRYLELPAILHWEFDHFVVLERCRREGFDVVDPAYGRVRVTREEMSRAFTGVVLVFEATTDLKKRKVQPVSWRRYAAFVLAQKRRLLALVALSALLLGLNLATPFLTAFVIDRVIPARSLSLLGVLGLGLVAIAIVYGGFSMLRSFVLIRLQALLDRRMMASFFRTMLDLPVTFFQLRSSGDLLMRLSSNAVVRNLLSQQLVSVTLDVLLMVVYLAAMMAYELRLALVVVGIAAAQLAIAVLSVRLVKPLADREVQAQARSQSYLAEALRGVNTIKAAAAEQQVLRHWRGLLDDELEASMARQRRSAQMSSLQAMLSLAAPAVLLLAGAGLVMHGRMQLGEMLGFNVLAGSFLSPLGTLVGSIQSLQMVRTHLERLDEVYEHEPERPAGRAFRDPGTLRGGIELRGVSFRYGSREPFVIAGVDLDIRPGMMVAIVGPSGAGKSTLLKLIAGLLRPAEGAVLYDGVNISELDMVRVRRQLGIVLQEDVLFAGSIRDNIALANPGLDLEKIRRAARLAEIDDFIESLPLGYSTPLAEMAGNLSGGQRQRLCLARALAHEPRILILDEATSELDAETEAKIHRNLASLSCTRIVAAHRLSTVRGADLIVVLDKGRVVEAGTHEELVRLNGTYASLVQFQNEAAMRRRDYPRRNYPMERA